MKLDVDVLRYLSKDDFRVLQAVEMGMRNHEIVPSELIDRIATLRRGGTYKVLKNLLKHKLVHHDSSKYDGFRLTYLGYDFLAINAMVKRGVFTAVGRQIGVGKESDIFEVATEDGGILAMKLHRLGRTSFRAVKSKRDYLKHRSNYSWLYLSRLSACKEFAFMKVLGEHKFPVPNAVSWNRHCVVMSLVQGYPLVQVKQLQNPDLVFETIIGLVVRLAEHGLIHCDFNEFNIMIDDDESVTMIDFPQMVSVSHHNAKMYFDRDVECIFKFFNKRFSMSSQENTTESDGSESDLDDIDWPSFSSITKVTGLLDEELAASGFTNQQQDELEKFIEGDVEKYLTSDDEGIAAERVDLERNVKDINSLSLQDQITKGVVEKDLASDDGGIAAQREDLERNINEFNSFNLQEQGEKVQAHGKTGVLEVGENLAGTYASVAPGNQDASDEEDDERVELDEDPELTKRLSKQRQQAIAAAHRGKRSTSRNTYKAKGRKSLHNSKIQKQLNNW